MPSRLRKKRSDDEALVPSPAAPWSSPFALLLAAAWLIAASAFVFAATIRLPILLFPFNPAPADRAYWAMLQVPNGVPYEQRLLWLPLIASGAMALAGVFMAVLARVREAVRWRAGLQVAVLCTATCSSFVLALVGTRWLGFFLARLAEPGPSPAFLGIGPYASLVAGLSVLVPGVVTMQRIFKGGVRWKGTTFFQQAAASAFALLFLPLIPFAYGSVFGRTIPLDELSIAVLAANRGLGSLDVPACLGWSRVGLWAILATCAAMSLLSPTNRWARGVSLFTIILAMASASFLVRFYAGLHELGSNYRAGPNPILPLALLAVSFLGAKVFRQRGTKRRVSNAQDE